MFNTKVRLLLIAFMLFSSILPYPAPAWACLCVASSSPQEAFIQADAVFVGSVTTSGDALWNPLYAKFTRAYHQFVPPLPRIYKFGAHEKAMSFDVEASWRGVNTTQITVLAGHGIGCGYRFEQDKQYLVYAHQSSDGALRASNCSRTTVLENAGEDLDYLRTVSKVELADSPLMFNSLMLCLAIGLLGAIVLAVMMWRRRDTSRNDLRRKIANNQ